MSAVVYKIDHGYITATGGGSVPVFRFGLSLVQNGIPTLTCEIDPFHKGTGALKDGKGSYVKLAKFAAGYTRYKALFRAMERRVGASASFSFSMTGTNGDKQTLDLKDWIITDAGLGSYTFSGAVSVLVTLSHPAVKLNDGNMFITGKAVNSARFEPAKGNNVLQALVANLRKLNTVNNVIGVSAGVKALQERTKDLIETLDTRLEWFGPKWPAMGILNAYQLHAVASTVLGMRPVTPWELISRELVNRWFLSLRPTYWKDKLEIGPCNPWAASTISISDNSIEMTSVPSTGDRLSGIVNTSLSPALIGTSAAQWGGGLAAAFNVTQAHIESIAGPVLPAMIPDYLTVAAETYLRQETSGMDLITQGITNPNDPAVQVFASKLSTALTEHMQKVCEQVFCMYYRQNAPITLKTHLMLNNPAGVEGAHVVPGHACTVVSGEGNTGVMKFLVTAVDHVVDCNAHEAYTIINGAYTAPVGEPNLTAITGGVVEENYAYR